MNTDMIITGMEPECTAYTIDSREVAEMVEKSHAMLLRDIRRYTKQLGECKIASTVFWAENTYQDTQDRPQPCYLITKKGCEFIAHKMTGTKGTVFTARYIERFHQMEEALKADQAIPENAAQGSPALMEFIRQQSEINRRQEEFNSLLLKILEMQGEAAKPECEYIKLPEDITADYLNNAVFCLDVTPRVRSLMKKVETLADLNRCTVKNILHELYEAVEDFMNLDLQSFVNVYRWETGDKSRSPLRVIAAHEYMYEAACKLLDNSINYRRR